jgi:hypothetical protein
MLPLQVRREQTNDAPILCGPIEFFKAFHETFPVNGNILHIMFTGNGLGGSTTFKNNFRVE